MEIILGCAIFAVLAMWFALTKCLSEKDRRKYSAVVKLYEWDAIEWTYEGTFMTFGKEDVIDAMHRLLGIVYYYQRKKYRIEIVSLRVTK